MSRWRVSRGIQRSFTRSYQASLFSPSSKGLTFTYLSSPIKLTKLGFFSRDTDPGAVLPLPPGKGRGEGFWVMPPSILPFTLTFSQREGGRTTHPRQGGLGGGVTYGIFMARSPERASEASLAPICTLGSP